MEMKQCAKGGHLYNASIYAECPYCVETAEDEGEQEVVSFDTGEARPMKRYKMWISFYIDFQERMKETPGWDSIASYFMQYHLLHKIGECAKDEGVEMEPFLLDRINTVRTILEENYHIRVRWDN